MPTTDNMPFSKDVVLGGKINEERNRQTGVFFKQKQTYKVFILFYFI